MEMNSSVHLEDKEDSAQSGSPTEVYSMREGSHTRSADERHTDPHKDVKKKPEAKKGNDVLYWRLGLGLAIIVILTGVVYFVGKGINWGIKKISGRSQVSNYTTTLRSDPLRSNADPRLAYPTGPVVSNMNMIPVGATPDSSGQVLGATTPVPATQVPASSGSGRLANGCPYYASSYYYCEWQDEYTYRPYNTPEEYAAAHQSQPVVAPRYSGYAVPTYTYPTTSYTAPSSSYTYAPAPGYSYGGSSLDQAIAASKVRSPRLPNGCPAYTGDDYVYCTWPDEYTFRGFRAGEY